MAERLPFGDDQERIGALDATVVARSKLNAAAENLLGFVHRLRIVCGNGCAVGNQAFDDLDCRGVAHVIRSRVEGKTPHPESLVAKAALKMTPYFVDKPDRLGLIDGV